MHLAAAVRFLISGFSIVLIDLLLAGDNALVIAMVVRSLPRRQRRAGIVFGATGAVLLRVALTAFAATLLSLEYVEMAGGIFVLWIALKVLVDASDPPDAAPAPRHLLQAIWFIVFADLTMSTDNILAIAGAARGEVSLIIFGLGLSIPFVVFSSNLLANLMDRYPSMIYLGVAILGKVAGDMILEDRFMEHAIHLSNVVHYGIDAVLIVVLLVAGKQIAALRRRAETDSKVRFPV